MIFYTSRKPQAEFDRNLADWYAGGPRPHGWTRTGPPLPARSVALTRYGLDALPVDEVLAKNAAETTRWHMAFLLGGATVAETDYYWEYLVPRYGQVSGGERAAAFRGLRADVARCGVRTPVWVADVGWLGLGFRYFRFDGCHRTCAAKAAGLAAVPALVFSTEAGGSPA
jgi:hypothetical protein